MLIGGCVDGSLPLLVVALLALLGLPHLAFCALRGNGFGGVYAIVIVFAAMMSGVGGGAFASSMANINPFYPRRRAGYALGMNGGLGNLGVSLCQLLLANVLMVYGASSSAVGGLWVANGPWFLFPARAPLPCSSAPPLLSHPALPAHRSASRASSSPSSS